MTPLEGIEARDRRMVDVGSEDLEGLLYDFLDQLLFIHDSELLVFSEIDVELDEETLRLKAECRGERFNPEKHKAGIVVKAVTFHQMRIEKREEGWSVRVVFDT